MNETVNEKNNASSENIKVFVRVKGPSNGTDSCLKINGNTITAGDSQFSFDYIGDGDTTQDTVFQTVGIPIATSVLEGYNGTIFAYGQTGTGKTYTMQGPFYSIEEHNNLNNDKFYNKKYLGLIPRIISYIFARISRETEFRRQDEPPIQYICQASYYEIYNEQIFDLLTDSTEPLNIHEDIKRGVFIDRLTTRNINTAEEVYKILEIGAWKRSTASTRINTQSSRSHSVFTLMLQSKMEKEGITQIQESKLNLVDLAGSERQKLTGTTGQRLLEAKNINKSLSALGQVIQSLVDINNNKKKVHVGYRNSKLTFLLKDSLGGNSKTFLIANISPSAFSLAETLSTLRFAQCAKQVTNRAIVNQNVEENISNLKDQIYRLQQEINKLKEKESKSFYYSKSPEEINLYEFFDEWTKIHHNMEIENKDLIKKMETIKEIKQNQDAMIKSYAMIIKIRDSMIQQLREKIESGKTLLLERKIEETGSFDLPECFFNWDNENKLLLDEINELKLLHEPERKKLEKENFILQNQIDNLKKDKLEIENYHQRTKYQQRYIGLLTTQWFDLQRENQYLKQQLQLLLSNTSSSLLIPNLSKINENNLLPNKENISQKQNLIKLNGLSTSNSNLKTNEISITNEININHNTNFLININQTSKSQEQNIKNFEEKLLESEQFLKEFNNNLRNKTLDYFSHQTTPKDSLKTHLNITNDKTPINASTPFPINSVEKKKRRETLALKDLFPNSENVEDLMNMSDIYGIREGSLSQKHDLSYDFDSFEDDISFKRQRISFENDKSFLNEHLQQPSPIPKMEFDYTPEVKKIEIKQQQQSESTLIKVNKEILNDQAIELIANPQDNKNNNNNVINIDINCGSNNNNDSNNNKILTHDLFSDDDELTVKEEKSIKSIVIKKENTIHEDFSKSLVKVKKEEDESKHTSGLSMQASKEIIHAKEEVEKALTEQFVKIEEELKMKNSELQNKLDQLEEKFNVLKEKHDLLSKEKESESIKLLSQYDEKNKELLAIVNENKTLKQELEFAEDNKKQINEQQTIISNLNQKILTLEKAYELEKSEKKILNDQLQKYNDEQKKNDNYKLELQDQYNLIKNENIGLQLKIDQTENLNEDLKNENKQMKIYLDSYKDKCEKIDVYKEKIEKEIQNVLNSNDISNMELDQQLKELFKMYNGFKNDLSVKEDAIKIGQTQIQEIQRQYDQLNQNFIDFKQSVEKEKVKHHTEQIDQLEQIEKLKNELKAKNIKLFENHKAMEQQCEMSKEIEEKVKDLEFKLEISNLRYEDLQKKMAAEKTEKLKIMEKLESNSMDERKKAIIINNLTLDVEKYNHKLKERGKMIEHLQQENEKLLVQVHQCQNKDQRCSQEHQELQVKLNEKMKEADHYVRKLREYERERFETAKKLNALEELKQLHEKDMEEIQKQAQQLKDTQKLAEEATLIATNKENEKNTLLESYEENKKAQQDLVDEYKSRMAQKEKESRREVKALRQELQNLKKSQATEREQYTKEYEVRLEHLQSEITTLEEENETLRNENLNLVMPKNQHQRIKYLRKIKNESDHWKETALRFRRELDKRGIYIKL